MLHEAIEHSLQSPDLHASLLTRDPPIRDSFQRVHGVLVFGQIAHDGFGQLLLKLVFIAALFR